ncbi:TPA: capsid protein [Serratia liquefaciens]|nr:capsid protein [Serratia liquefaciens]
MKPEAILPALKAAIAKQNEVPGAQVAGGLDAFTAATESAQADKDWRSRFRTLCGNMTPEMKAEHNQRVASRELAEEFSGLIAELETDKQRAMLDACRSGEAYVGAHARAFTTYANAEWQKAMLSISPVMLRAFLLRIQSLEMESETSPRVTAMRELGDSLKMQSGLYQFDMDKEPVLSVIGMRRPALTGVDMKLYRSPAKRGQLASELAARKTQKEEG